MSTTRPLAIAKIGEMDQGGGAAAVASGLMRGYRSLGHQVWQFVGRKRGDDPSVIPLADDERPAARATGYAAAQRLLRRCAARHPDRGFGLASRSLRLVTHPSALIGKLRGLEDFDFPGTHHLLERLDRSPDVVHAHNLHGGFFDLRALASLTAQVPTILTLHDMWVMTGHCAHALGCDRWQRGCGACPDLTLDPAIHRDATAANWQRKQQVFSASRLHIATPSRWLREQVDRSMLAPLVQDVRVIANGVDTAVFRPGDRAAARVSLGLPLDRQIVLLTAGSRGSMWKDDRTLHGTMRRLVATRGADALLFVAVGRESAARISGAPVRSDAFVHDAACMARYYQAADLYLHAARADTFPLAILEAMACGAPVIATEVGGIAEQIVPASVAAVRARAIGHATGVLVDAGAEADMATAADALLADAETGAQMGANGVRRVRACFSLGRQVEAYLSWYRELLAAAS